MAEKRNPYWRDDNIKATRRAYYEKRKAEWRPLPPGTLRKCDKCETEKPIESFRKMAMGRQGYNNWCIECDYSANTLRQRRYKENSWPKVMVKFVNARQVKKTGQKTTLSARDILDMWELQGGKCFWFKVPLKTPKYGQHRHDPWKVTLDRLDCSKGYERSNVVLACHAANMGRSDTPVDEWCDFIQHIRK